MFRTLSLPSILEGSSLAWPDGFLAVAHSGWPLSPSFQQVTYYLYFENLLPVLYHSLSMYCLVYSIFNQSHFDECLQTTDGCTLSLSPMPHRQDLTIKHNRPLVITIFIPASFCPKPTPSCFTSSPYNFCIQAWFLYALIYNTVCLLGQFVHCWYEFVNCSLQNFAIVYLYCTSPFSGIFVNKYKMLFMKSIHIWILAAAGVHIDWVSDVALAATYLPLYT